MGDVDKVGVDVGPGLVGTNPLQSQQATEVSHGDPKDDVDNEVIEEDPVKGLLMSTWLLCSCGSLPGPLRVDLAVDIRLLKAVFFFSCFVVPSDLPMTYPIFRMISL